MITYEGVSRAVRKLMQELDAQRRVIVCPRHLKTGIQEILDHEPTGHLFKVLSNDYVGDRVVLIDPNVHTEFLNLWEEDHD